MESIISIIMDLLDIFNLKYLEKSMTGDELEKIRNIKKSNLTLRVTSILLIAFGIFYLNKGDNVAYLLLGLGMLAITEFIKSFVRLIDMEK